ncbi:MAG: Vgb family protein [Candidatus Wenzhouxiangella sp. M2_3B_020]
MTTRSVTPIKRFAAAIFVAMAWVILATPVRAAEVYVSDAANFNLGPWKILRFDAHGENGEAFITSNLGWPQDLVFLEDQGVVLVSNLTTNRINRHDIETGEFIDQFASVPGGPTRMSIGPDGLIYVLQWRNNGPVLRFELDGTPLGAFTSRGVPQSLGLDWDAQGRLYIASFNGASVHRFDVDGRDLGLFIASNLTAPSNIWFGDGGDLFVNDFQGGAIRRFSSDGVFKGNFVSGLSQPEGMAELSDGTLLIGNGGTSSVLRFDETGASLDVFVESGTLGLFRPNAVVTRDPFRFDFEFDAEGQWVADNADLVGNSQGLTLDYMGFADLLFVAWFTYVDRGTADLQTGVGVVGAEDNRWLTAQLEITGNVATGPLFASTGGRFDAPPQVDQETVEVGTLTIEFTACDRATVEYQVDSAPLAGTFSAVPLEVRVNPDFECRSEVAAAK